MAATAREDVAVTVASGLEEILAAGQPVCLEVVSRSMWPFLRPGDRVQVARCEGAALRPGDVVAVRGASSVIVHRFLGWRRAGGGLAMLTRGDAARGADEPQPVERLLGRVEAVGRAGRDGDLRWHDLRLPRWRAASRMGGAIAQAATLATYGLRAIRHEVLCGGTRRDRPMRPGAPTAREDG